MAIRTCLIASLAAVAACGSDGKSQDIDALIILPDAAPDAPPDAFEPTFDLGCVGNAEGPAAANVTLAGFTVEITNSGTTPQIQAAHNVKVDVCKATSTTCLNADLIATQNTPATGCPSTGCTFTTAALATGGQPLDVYVKATKAANRPTYIYPASRVTANVSMIPAAMFTSATFVLLQQFQIIDQDAGKGNLIIPVTDCANMPISDSTNVTLSIKQGNVAVAGTQTIDAGDFSAQLAGTFFVFNVPAGVTEVGATYKTTTMRAHDVRVFADSTTGTPLRPGF